MTYTAVQAVVYANGQSKMWGQISTFNISETASPNFMKLNI